MNPVIIAALIAGIFGVVGSLVSFWLLRVQTRATKTLEREFKQFETGLKVGSDVELRLYEKALEDLAKYKSLLKNLHIALGDYKNGIYHQGSSSETERKNTFRFYEAWNELRFPGVYIPSRIADEIEKIRFDYQELKDMIKQAGFNKDIKIREQNLSQFGERMDFMEKQTNRLVLKWKSKLLNSKNILMAILDTEGLAANQANQAEHYCDG